MARDDTIHTHRGTNLEGASTHNRRAVIEVIRANRTLSRAEAARLTGLTKQTVSNIVHELETSGLVRPLPTVRRGRGQPVTPYELVPEGAFSLGLQIDRHFCRLVVADLLGTQVIREEIPLPSKDGPEGGVTIILTLIADARRDLERLFPGANSRLVGLGVALPGPFDLAVDLNDPWVMTAWHQYPLRERLSETTGLDVALRNDAAAAAVAEQMLGKAAGLEHAVCLFLGYGVGAGIIVNGEIYSGRGGNAGEIGMALFPDGAPLDRARTIEHDASIGSLCRALDLDPARPDLDVVIARALEAPSPTLLAWLEGAVLRLRWAIQLLEVLLDPQTVILCGTDSRQLLEALAARLEPLPPSLAQRITRNRPRLEVGLGDPWSVARGAAAEAQARIFSPRLSAILIDDR